MLGVRCEPVVPARDGTGDRDAGAAIRLGIERDGHLLAVEVVPEHDHERELHGRSVAELARAAFGQAESDGARGIGETVRGPRVSLGRTSAKVVRPSFERNARSWVDA
jgi:hypothetical protein